MKNFTRALLALACALTLAACNKKDNDQAANGAANASVSAPAPMTEPAPPVSESSDMMAPESTMTQPAPESSGMPAAESTYQPPSN